jgi:hypothetical protein
VLDTGLVRKIRALDLDEYMAGISPEELAELIRG